MKVVYLSDGAQRTITIGKQTVKFKKASPKNLATKGKISGLVIQALREIGNGNVTENQKAVILKHLEKEDPDNIRYDAKLAPVWISKILMSSLK